MHTQSGHISPNRNYRKIAVPDPISARLGTCWQSDLLPSDEREIRYVAAERTSRNAGRPKSCDLGSAAKNAAADLFGVRAEVLVIRALESVCLSPDYTLLADKSVPEPDLFLDGFFYDVKSVRPGALYVCINAKKQRTSKTDFWLIVVFDSNTEATVYQIPRSHVFAWDLRKAHSSYFSVTIPYIQAVYGNGGQA